MPKEFDNKKAEIMSDFKPGKPEVLDMVEVDFEHQDTKKKRLAGRPHGSKGKANLFKDQMEAHFQKIMRKDFKDVLKTTVTKAIEGDMSATKILFDRVIPAGKAVDLSDNKGTPMININIGNLDKPEIINEK